MNGYMPPLPHTHSWRAAKLNTEKTLPFSFILRVRHLSPNPVVLNFFFSWSISEFHSTSVAPPLILFNYKKNNIYNKYVLYQLHFLFIICIICL
jgi:hypothetical protein